MHTRSVDLPRRLRGAAALVAVALGLTGCAGASGGGTSGGGASHGTAAPTTRPRPPGQVRHLQLALVDRSRAAVDPSGERSAASRALPTELYLPADHGPRPLVVLAHGYDGDPGKFDHLLTHWAEAGFVVAAPRFPITYTGASAAGLARSGDYSEQPADVRFVIDELLASRYRSRIDRSRIGLAGLSLGGGTAWALVAHPCCRDPRIDAAIVMDGMQFPFAGAEFGANRIPLLVFHADRDPALPFAAARDAYLRAAPPKWFVTIFGVLHAQPFEDSPSAADAMVERTTTDFWEAWLLDDDDARAALLPDATVDGVSTAEAVTR